jgi:steroid delta-isomerase-like uncharacterized protein
VASFIGGSVHPAVKAARGRRSGVSEQNKTLIRRWIEEVQKGNVDVMDEVLAPDFVDHSLLPGQGSDREGYRQGLSEDRDAFPDDLEITIEDQIAEGDKVMTRYRWRGTHTRGRFLDVPATGRKIEGTAIDVHCIVGGKVKEEWSASDTLGMLRQLGAAPER